MFQSLPSKVTVVEVGPRDGLQSEPEVVPTAVDWGILLAATPVRPLVCAENCRGLVNPGYFCTACLLVSLKARFSKLDPE